VVSSRVAGGRRAPVRRLPPVVLLLLAALTVAAGPVPVGRSASTALTPAAVRSVDAGRHASADGTVDGTVPGNPARVDLRHAAARTAVVERPPLDAVLPGVAFVVALLVLIARRGGEQRRPRLALPSGSARGPPAPAV
jgi:hypothetical protein